MGRAKDKGTRRRVETTRQLEQRVRKTAATKAKKKNEASAASASAAMKWWRRSFQSTGDAPPGYGAESGPLNVPGDRGGSDASDVLGSEPAGDSGHGLDSDPGDDPVEDPSCLDSDPGDDPVEVLTGCGEDMDHVLDRELQGMIRTFLTSPLNISRMKEKCRKGKHVVYVPSRLRSNNFVPERNRLPLPLHVVRPDWAFGAGGYDRSCIFCGCQHTTTDGWTHNPWARKVIGASSPILVASGRIACRSTESGGCGRSFAMTHPGFLNRLSLEQRLEVADFVFTKRSGLTGDVVHSMVQCVGGSGMSMHAFRTNLCETHARRHAQLMSMSYGERAVKKQALEKRPAEGFFSNESRPVAGPLPPPGPRFPPLLSKGAGGYNGAQPSTDWLTSVFLRTVFNDRAMYETLMAVRADGDILSADDSFKVHHCLSCGWCYTVVYVYNFFSFFDVRQVTKRMFKIRGAKNFTGLFTVVNNRTNEVILSFFTTKRTHEVLQVLLERLGRVRRELGYPDLQVVYVDNPEQDEWLWLSAFPELQRPYPPEALGLPAAPPPVLLRLNTTPTVCSLWGTADAAATALFNRRMVAASVDTEWPTCGWGKAKRGPVSLVSFAPCDGWSSTTQPKTADEWQVLADQVVVTIFHLAQCRKVRPERVDGDAPFMAPPGLQHLLESDTVPQVGKGIAHCDYVHLRDDYGIRLGRPTELSRVGKSRGLWPDGRIGLAGMLLQLTGLTLPKAHEIRTSNWATSTLSAAQVEYAALDVVAGVLVRHAVYNNGNVPLPTLTETRPGAELAFMSTSDPPRVLMKVLGCATPAAPPTAGPHSKYRPSVSVFHSLALVTAAEVYCPFDCLPKRGRVSTPLTEVQPGHNLYLPLRRLQPFNGPPPRPPSPQRNESALFASDCTESSDSEVEPSGGGEGEKLPTDSTSWDVNVDLHSARSLDRRVFYKCASQASTIDYP